ncbi:flagellar assembly protein FliW [Aciditerrimonas ferrireducens]|uniref:Flagellar assembly factor FliW n=1 Tax=Aciditerrimonas ferrireducens TaxID=667306 RepID=A0ABV6BZJ1_9ACTN
MPTVITPLARTGSPLAPGEPPAPPDAGGAGALAEVGIPPVLHFEHGLPGFPEARAFALEPLGPALAPFARLQSLDQPGLGFTVVPPGLLFPDYRVEVDEDWASRLGLRAPEDAKVLVLVTLRPGQAPTANLLGPLVVHRRSGRAGQVVQVDSGYGVAEPLVGASA